MSKLFTQSSTTLFRAALILILATILSAFFIGEFWKWSTYMTQVGIERLQPIQFSHKHHVKGDGIDCRYCHTSVETSSSAGMPSTETCMTCHSLIWTESPLLKAVRESLEKNVSIRWTRVHSLPDYVYFNHSIHVQKGISCVSCHGNVEDMPLVYKTRTFFMRDCLSCHREPERYIRPKDEVFNFKWHPPASSNPIEFGKQLVKEYGIHPNSLTQCYTCHR